jgi:tRNA-specific 2-thiouridylase
MPNRVIVAMSGGVDSSVALLKVLEAGYDAVGVTMKLWEYRDTGGNLLGESTCCPVEAINNAREICVSYGVPHYTLDFREAFQQTVIDNFVEEYFRGRTPNPCVRCNSYIKWDALLRQADQLGAQSIATGHYARIANGSDGKPCLLRGKDHHKDQSYMLWGINKDTLAQTLFPLGDMTKAQVRQIARNNKLITAEASESQEICFIADNNYARFLKSQGNGRLPDLENGEIVDELGKVIGSHRGYPFYTIGQRRGLGIAHTEPLYVKELNPAANQIRVAPQASLYSTLCYIENLNWLVDEPSEPVQVHARIRYNSVGAPAQLTPEGNRFRLEFQEPQLAITPGQSAVFYDHEVVMGGGIIGHGENS